VDPSQAPFRGHFLNQRSGFPPELLVGEFLQASMNAIEEIAHATGPPPRPALQCLAEQEEYFFSHNARHVCNQIPVSR
jgi:hypothetical protein